MRTLQSRFFRIVFAIMLVFAVLAGSARLAAAGNGAETWRDRVESWESEGSCADPDGIYQLTVVSSGAVHRLETEDGFKFSWAEHGTYVLEPVDADSPVTYSGRYNVQAQNQSGDKNFILHFTSTSTALGADGTRGVMHWTFHLIITPTGQERLVDNIKWICH